MNLPPPSPRVITSLLVGLALLATWTGVGDFRVRVANAIGNDHVVNYVRFLVSPSFYEGDSFLPNARVFGYASAVNWLGLGLHRALGLEPDLYSLVVLLAQYALFAVVLFRYARLLTESVEVAALVVLMVLAAEPWVNNLSYYPSISTYLYPGQTALILLMAAVGEMVRGRWRRCALWHGAAALVHASLALNTLVLMACYWWLGHRKKETTPRQAAWFLLPAALAVVPPLFLLSGSETRLGADVMMAEMRRNEHFFPWTTLQFRDLALPGLLSLLVLAALGARSLRERFPPGPRLFTASLMTLALAALLHVGAARLGIVRVLQLCPLRVTMVLGLVLAGLGFTYAAEAARGPAPARRAAGASLCPLGSFSPYGLFWLPLLLLLRSAWPRRTAWLIVVWFAVFLLAGEPMRRLFGAETAGAVRSVLFPNLYAAKFLLGPAMLGIAVAFLRPRVLPVFVGYTLLALAWRTGAEARREGWNRSNFLAQDWVSRNTAPDTRILVTELIGFRAYSGRRVVNALPPYMHVYTASPVTYAASRRMRDFYASQGVSDFAALSPEAMTAFAHRFGGDYLLWHDRSALPFPEAFTAPGLRLYRLPPASGQ